jgi:hypothetical protein
VKRQLTLAAAALSLVGCGNAADADVNGSTAITVDSHGHAVVLAAICHSSIDEVTISFDRKGLKETEQNKDVGTWKAAKPMKGLVELNLAAPGADWITTSTFTPQDDKGYIAIPAQSKADVEAAQIYFHGRDLAKLTPTTVLVGDPATIVKRSTFEQSCN